MLSFLPVSGQDYTYQPIASLQPGGAFNSYYGVAVNGSYAYILNENGYLWTVDISYLPTLSSNAVITNFISQVLINNNGGLLLNQGYLYTWGYNSLNPQSFGISILDISNPTNPVTIQRYITNSEVYAASLSGSNLIVTGPSFLQVFSAANPTNLISLSQLSLPCNYPFASAAFGTNLYIGAGYSWPTPGALFVLDFHNPYSPSLIHTVALNLQVTGDAPYQLRVLGSNLVSTATKNVTLLNLSNPDNPVLITNASSLNGRACFLDGDRAIINGQVWTVQSNALSLFSEFTSGNDGAGFPYGSTTASFYDSRFIFLCQGGQVLVLRAPPEIIDISPSSSNSVNLCFQSQFNVNYKLQWSASMPSTAWNDLLPTFPGEGGQMCIPDSPLSLSHRFYRLVRVGQP
jgi:hypothetical protein